MKIATNIHRDAFGGITISNLALFDWLEDKDDTIVGIEYLTTRAISGAVIFRRFDPSFFSHHIINGLDIFTKYPWTTTTRLRKKWAVLIEATKEVLRQTAPDVVLVNGTYFAPLILGQAAHELGIPIVLRYAGVLKREVEHENFFVRRRLFAHERWLALHAARLIFPSALCRQVVEKEILKHPATDGVVIPNPATAQEISGTRRGRRNRRFTIATIGRWSRNKNFQAFVAMHRALLRAPWPHRAILVTSFRDKQFDVPETIEWKEPMSQDALHAFYRSMDLLVVPSRFETFCNVAAEALVNGTSVLVSKNVGLAEGLKKVGLGRMVIDSFDDPEKVSTAVRRLAKTRVTAKEQAMVRAWLDPHSVHERILHVLAGVLSPKEDFPPH